MDTVVRVALVYLLIIAILRALGKRDLSQLSPLELVMLLLIPEIVSQGVMRDDYSLVNSLIALTTLMGLVYLSSALGYRFRGLNQVMEGEPMVLVRRGRVSADLLRKERISMEELGSEMRKAGIETLDRVKWAVLEPDGKISFIGYEPRDARRPGDEKTAH